MRFVSSHANFKSDNSSNNKKDRKTATIQNPQEK